MAYTRFTSHDQNTPVPCDPGVLCAYVANSSAESNVPVYVPWDNCQLVHAIAVVTGAAIDGTGAMEIDLELDAASGTEMMTISVAASSAVGDIDEVTISSRAACQNLKNGNIVMIEVDGSADATGGANIYLFFEPHKGVA